MRINKTKKTNNKKRFAIIAIVALLAIIGYGVFAFTTHGWPFLQNDSSQDSTKSVDPKAADKIKSEAVEQDADKTSTGSDTPQQPTTDPTTGATTVEMNVTNYGPVGGSYSIHFEIQALVSSGTCTVKFTPTTTGKSYTATAGIQALSRTSTCKGFDTISQAELPEGAYTVEANFTSGTTSGSLSQKIQVSYAP